MTTYADLRAKLADINSRILALKQTAPRIGIATTADFEHHSAAVAAVNAEARAAGFVRIFDGSFKLNPEQSALA